jgi:long-chain acyl-CoA synthetase
LSGEELSRAIQNGHITGMVGVPALWEMLHRRIKSRLRERGDWFADLADNIMTLTRGCAIKRRSTSDRLSFFRFIKALGGKMRYPDFRRFGTFGKVQKDLHGLGFTVLEGYGLTESAPVLTVTRPQNKLNRGSVGKPLARR